MSRLEQGGRIDRSQPVSFTFNGKQYTAFKGDTIASALLANGVKKIGRSWKYHRPRGFVGDGVEEPNGLFQVEKGKYTVPNVRGTEAEVYEGMVIQSTNAWPSVNFDIMAVFGLFARFLPAGFYYKTFMWPASFWKSYEHVIRKASGLGRSPRLEDPDHYEKRNAHCDVLVIGSGAAGLSAALTAAKSGARVMLVDEQAEFGGRMLSERAMVNQQSASSWAEQAITELSSMDDVVILKRSTAFGYHDSNFVTVNQRLTDHLPLAERSHSPREKIWRVRAKKVVLATGAHERPIVFGNNDRPGVMLASAVSAYIKRYAVKPANRAVVFCNNDSAYQTALDLHEAGVNIAAVVDCRSKSDCSAADKVGQLGIRVIKNSYIAEALGGSQVSGAVIKGMNNGAASVKIDCELIAVSGGWNPAIHLLAQSGGKVAWNDEKAIFEPSLIVQDHVIVGAANGKFTLQECLAEGRDGANKLLVELGFGPLDLALPTVTGSDDLALMPLWHVPSADPAKPWRGAKQFIDMQNDVGVSDIYLAAREGFESIEHVKRYTALGFGTDQGKTGNIVGMAILAEALNQDISSTGTTTFRPNYTPVSFGAVAGPDVKGTMFDPIRKTAMHEWHAENGALFENVGQWHRAWYYPKQVNGKLETMHEAVDRECLATRNSVGIMDASTLGKIEIVGKDAGEFLNRIYTNAWKKLGIDCARYGFMLGEDGMVMDDGVTIRLDEERYFMHTTTGGAASVLAWMELWLQTEWPELEVYMTSVTDHWATAAVVGPNSRKVVSKVVDGIDFDKDAFGFMTSREGTIDGLPVRVNRISFSGELSYEINVLAHAGRHVWERLMEAGAEYDITPYGTEAMHVLRAEKGFVIVGQDTDGSVTPVDLGMNWVLSKNKDYLGRRSLGRSDCVREGRKQFVGLRTKDPQTVLEEGGQILNERTSKIPAPMLGHVTSSYYSAFLGHSIALAVVKGGFDKMGDTVFVASNDGEWTEATITETVFLDPKGERQHV